MANTYTLITSTVLGSTTASVTLSSIPQTFTDMVLIIQARCTSTNIVQNNEIALNGGGRRGRWAIGVGNGTAPSAATYTNFGGSMTSGAASSGIYGAAEYYIPKYTNTTDNKIVNTNTTAENAGVDTEIDAVAGLSLTTVAVTSIVCTPGAGSYAAGSLFELYGIKRG